MSAETVAKITVNPGFAQCPTGYRRLIQLARGANLGGCPPKIIERLMPTQSTSTLSFSLPEVHAVILDMDGTLLDTETVYKACTLDTLAKLGWPDQFELIHDMVGLSSAKCDALLIARLGDQFPLAQYHDIFKVGRAARVQTGITLKHGTLALLDLLGCAKFPTAIATSSSRVAAEQHLTIAGIRSRFETVVTVDDVAHAKPDPEVYLHAAALLGVEPRHCVAVEDSAAGVLAASLAGMSTYMVPDMNSPDAETAKRCTAVCKDLTEFVELLVDRVPRLRPIMTDSAV